MRESEKDSLINKSNERKKHKNHKGSSHSNDSGKIRGSTLSLISHHDLDTNCNRPVMNSCYGSLEDVDGDTKRKDQYSFNNIQKNVHSVKRVLQNGGKLSRIDKNYKNKKDLTNNNGVTDNKMSKLAKFLVRKKIKMKHKKKMSRHIAFKGLLQFLYARVLPIERHCKILRKKYIKVSTVQEEKRMRKRSQIKFIFANKPNKLNKQLNNVNKCFIRKDNISNGNVSKERNYIRRKYIRKRLTTNYRNITGYKIKKIKKLKLYQCRTVPNKAKFKNSIKKARKKCREENFSTYNRDRNHDKEMLSTKEFNIEDIVKTIPKSQPVVRYKMENQNNVNITSNDKNNNVQYNSDENSTENTYRTFKKVENKNVRTPLPFMKDICIWLTSVLSIRRYERRSRKQKNTADKGAMALPLVKSSSCQCIGEYLDLSYDTNKKDEISVTKRFKQLKGKHLDQTVNSENISSSKDSLSDTKTKTTICSLCIIDRYIKGKAKFENTNDCNKINGSDKNIPSNRSKLCDASISTNDWWSPLEERKGIRNLSKRYRRRNK